MPSDLDLRLPIELVPLFQEKVWGREDLTPFYSSQHARGGHLKERIGEVWFTFKDNGVKTGGSATLGELIGAHPAILGETFDAKHPNQCPLLAKLLFTTERLSVQVHPKDDYAYRHHQSLGKTEAWYVVAAEPGADVAVGFKETLTPARMQEAAQSGEIENLLDWRPVKAGDTIFVPAGTVHAIGAGVTICEIQQNSDITYRLYDYGRPRELHLDHGVNVSELGPHHYRVEPRELRPGREELVVCDYFRIEKLRVAGRLQFPRGSAAYYLLLVCVGGRGQIGGETFEGGTSWLVPAGAEPFTIEGDGSEWIVAYTAAQAAGF